MGQADRDFTLRQLRTFICAARTGSFSHAAAELGISQPAVSDQIALLEHRLGHTLFLRRLGTTPQLTPEGAKLLESAGSLLDTSKAMRCEEAKRQAPHVRIGIGPRVLELYLKPLLPSLYLDFPGLSIDILPQLSRGDVQEALERGRVDLVIYTINELPEGWQNSRAICKVMVVMAGPPASGRSWHPAPRSWRTSSSSCPPSENRPKTNSSSFSIGLRSSPASRSSPRVRGTSSRR